MALDADLLAAHFPVDPEGEVEVCHPSLGDLHGAGGWSGGDANGPQPGA
jgi:hypothetical protein